MALRANGDTIVSVLLVASMCVVTALVAGGPDPGAAAKLLTGGAGAGVTTVADAAAFAGLLCWCLAAALAGTVTIRLIRELSRTQRKVHRTARATLFLVCAVVLLAAALLRHVSQDGLCCAGSTQQIEQVVHLAR